MKHIRFHYLLFLAMVCFLIPAVQAQDIPSPEQFYGFKIGTDGELARWDKIVEYFHLLDQQSDRLIVRTLGESTLGNPFILAIFSSAENLQNLDKYREINKKLADPRGLSDAEIDDLIQNGKYVSAQSYSLHATEVGGTQSTSELAYRLVTSHDPTIQMILDNTIFLMFPCFNPDGENMVVDWYYKYKGTDFNNTRLPYLYHFYTGHDNNRDSYQLTQKESRYFAKVVYRDWVPQSYVDHHHMGSSGARFYLPPYLDPIHPNVSPLIWREHQLYGSLIAVALENAGKSGFETGVPYTGWWQASFHMSTNYHNIAGMLTESASADWADPVYILPDQMGGTRGRPEYKPQMSMPRLWPGGWWRLRDIVEQQIVASKAVLEAGARYRATLLRDMVLKAKENIDKGKSEAPYAYILPVDQHDFLTAVKLARIFQMNGVEIHRLTKPYQIDSRIFNPGSLVISCAQPMRSFIVSFLEQVNYPDNTWTREHGTQDPIRPYDLAGYSVSEQMGVDAIPIMEPLRDISLVKIDTEITPPKGAVTGVGAYYLFDHRKNDSFKAMNRLLKQKANIYWTKSGMQNNDEYLPAGTMLVSGNANLQNTLENIAGDLGLNFYGSNYSGEVFQVKQPRLGLYKRYAGGNMDEGWTHWLLQDFEFDFTSLFNKDMKDSKLSKNYDVIIFPSDGYNRIVVGDTSKKVPPEYRGGIGDEGVKNVREFVKNGGTVIALNQSSEFVKKVFDLPIDNIVEDVPRRDFYCPGSTVKIVVDPTDPVAYGMPTHAPAMYRYSPVLQVWSGDFEDNIKIPVRYQEENILQSGWLIGEKYLSQKPAILEFNVDKGKVILLGFPVQHRAQTHGTFKFLFNAIFYGAAEEVELN